MKLRHSTIPWRQIAGAGNVDRHDYQLVGGDVVLRTIHESRPALGAVVDAELLSLANSPSDSP